MLSIRNLTGALALPLLMSFGVVAAHADEWNKETKITVNQAIEVPGAVLPAGSYIFKLVDSPSNRNIVQVMNPRQDHVYATVIAINNYRLVPRGKTVMTFYEVPAGQPVPVRAWFYPGDNYGQEFVYPKREMTQLASAKTEEVTPAPAAEQTAQVEQQQSQEDNQVAQNEPPAQPMPEATPAPESTPAPAPAPVMPQTGSDMPLLALAGLLSVSAAAGIGAFVKRTN